MKITIILLTIYLVSVGLMYLHVKLAFSKKGIWPSQNTSLTDVTFTIVPVVNTFICIIAWLTSWPLKQSNHNKSCNKFFRINK